MAVRTFLRDTGATSSVVEIQLSIDLPWSASYLPI